MMRINPEANSLAPYHPGSCLEHKDRTFLSPFSKRLNQLWDMWTYGLNRRG